MPDQNDQFERNIFINCPFDEEYKPMLLALLFTITWCGFRARIASEQSDSGEVRVTKIVNLIKESKFGIHDISRIEALRTGVLPRFNMPFELGLEFGCKCFASGSNKFKSKKCLILESEQYRYKQVLSDISGNDIRHHDAKPEKLVKEVRNWMLENVWLEVSQANTIWRRYNEFLSSLKTQIGDLSFSSSGLPDMPVAEFIHLIEKWKNSRKPDVQINRY